MMFAANPENTKFIPDEEFEDFRILAERVNNHVMGEADSTPERRQSISPNIDSRPGSGRFTRPSSRPSSPRTPPQRGGRASPPTLTADQAAGGSPGPAPGPALPGLHPREEAEHLPQH